MKTLLFSSSLLLTLAVSFLFSSCKKDEEAAPLTNLQLGKDTLFRKGATIKFSYSYSPKSSVMPDLRWESSDENVVAVKRDGTATAVNAGKATITLWVNDGTGLKSSRTVYVFEKPTISIQSVTDITYYSANFSLQYNMGGGDDLNSSCGFVWDTVPVLDTAKVVGRSRAATISTQQSIDMFDASKKYYIRAYAKTPFDITFSDSIILTTLPVPSDLMGNNMLNIMMGGGCVAKYKDWIYYMKPDDDHTFYLFRVKADLSQKEKIGEGLYNVSSINIIPPYIYLSIRGSNYFVKVRLNDNKPDFYMDGGEYITSWKSVVQGRYIYNLRSYLRMSTDGKEKVLKGDPLSVFYVYKDKLYDISRVDDTQRSINTRNLDGTGVTEIFRGGLCTSLGMYEDAVYFRENNTFKKFYLDNPSLIQVLPIRIGNYNIANNSIFFTNSEDGQKLYKSDLNGNLKVKLSDDCPVFLSVIDDWLYYYVFISDTQLDFYRIKQDGTNRQLVD